ERVIGWFLAQFLLSLFCPMKALRASAGTSQPVLSSQQVQTVFYQVPELRDMHQSFYSGLKARLSVHSQTDPSPGENREMGDASFELTVGDLFLKMIGLYGGFIENYKAAVQVVRKCTQSDPRFRTLAEVINTEISLLYKPLDRVTKTTLVLRDLLKTTPTEHRDYPVLQEALRLSRSFLSGVNESSQCKREVTLSHGMRRQLMRDGFVVDVSEGEGSLRHLFLYTDLLLCTRFKHATRGKQDQYRFCWYLPLAGLRLRWVAVEERSSDTHLRTLHSIRTKMYLLRQQLKQQAVCELEQMELMLFTHSPVYRLELHSPNGKSHSFLLSSLYELEEWREAIFKLTTEKTVPPDLLTLSRRSDPLNFWIFLSVPTVENENTFLKCTSVLMASSSFKQELSFQVDGAQNMRLLCVSQSDGQDDTVLGKASLWVARYFKYIKITLLVPHVVRCCAEEVERRGMDEVGIYRISGTTSDISTLKAAFNSTVTRLRCAEVNAVSGVLKLYFRELPEPLIPPELFQNIQDFNTRLVSMLSLLQSCPDANRHTFLYLMHHLQRVSEKQDTNKMSPLNLATVFGPSLLRPPKATLGQDGPAIDISQEVVVQVRLKIENVYLVSQQISHPGD
uniref:Uncharacterized protein n=1 Tax=Anabas testudineus TaxID=64144 RepID=A0A7N6A6R5_ANATE